MNSVMTIQFWCFIGAVSVCVGWTRLLYIDGVKQKLKRLYFHCLMHAAMIISVSGWAMTIGFYLHHSAVEVIENQAQVIQQLSAGVKDSIRSDNDARFDSMAFEPGTGRVADRGVVKTIEVRTKGGASVSWNSGIGSPAGPVLGTAERFGRGSGGIGRCDSLGSDQGGSFDSLRGIAFGSGRQF